MFRISYLVDDKHLATALRSLTGIARDLQVVPVVNAEPTKQRRVQALTDGHGYEILVDAMRKKGMTEITGPQAKSMMSEIGLTRSSYSHHLNEAVRNRLMKKSKSTGASNAKTYQLALLHEDKS